MVLKFGMNSFDLAVASKCNHSIFDYGTFGFWGAYLANGHTILAGNISQSEKAYKPETSIKRARIEHWTFVEAYSDNWQK